MVRERRALFQQSGHASTIGAATQSLTHKTSSTSGHDLRNYRTRRTVTANIPSLNGRNALLNAGEVLERLSANPSRSRCIHLNILIYEGPHNTIQISTIKSPEAIDRQHAVASPENEVQARQQAGRPNSRPEPPGDCAQGFPSMERPTHCSKDHQEAD